MFPWVQQYIDQAKPHVLSAAQTAEAMGERIIARLDLIVDAVHNDEFHEARLAPMLTFLAAGTQFVGTLHTDESWEIESVWGNDASDVSVTLDGQTRWTKTFAGRETAGGAGVVLTGPGEVAITTTADITVGLQVKVKRPSAAKRTRAAGQREPGIEPTNTLEGYRHAAPGLTSRPNALTQAQGPVNGR